MQVSGPKQGWCPIQVPAAAAPASGSPPTNACPSATDPSTPWCARWPCAASPTTRRPSPKCTGYCPGGRLLLLDHVPAPNPLLRAGQRLFEIVTSRIAADYQTRRPLPLLQQAGFDIETSQRSRAGTVERVRASKPIAAT